MRDLVVRESLRNLAEGASERFRELVRSGEEVPYEVREPGQGSPLATYAPLTDRFIRERTAMVSRLDAFGAAKAAIMNAGIARPYLEALGLEPVDSEGRRAEDAIVAFLCRLWDGRTDFAYEPSRVDAVITELEAAAEAEVDDVEVVVPVIGLRMTAARLELAEATLVRSDVVEAPSDVSAPEGSGRAGWEPQFLISTRCKIEEIEPTLPGDADGRLSPRPRPLTEKINRVVSALRLFKPGGVALGPHAWIRTGGGRWRRIATGAARPRPGAYRLADSELAGLAGLSRALEKLRRQPSGPTPAGVERAISRFEAGLGRDAVLEALNDHLLALRFLLEGDGPANTEMSWRVAALCAEPGERDAVRATIERALALERELWSGDPALGYDGRTPLEVASEIEDFTRAILRDAACGHLGQDLRATADEILLADGLAAGEGSASQRGETSEWGMGEVPEIVIERTEPEREADPGDRRRVRRSPDRGGARRTPAFLAPRRRARARGARRRAAEARGRRGRGGRGRVHGTEASERRLDAVRAGGRRRERRGARARARGRARSGAGRGCADAGIAARARKGALHGTRTCIRRLVRAGAARTRDARLPEAWPCDEAARPAPGGAKGDERARLELLPGPGDDGLVDQRDRPASPPRRALDLARVAVHSAPAASATRSRSDANR